MSGRFVRPVERGQAPLGPVADDPQSEPRQRRALRRLSESGGMSAPRVPRHLSGAGIAAAPQSFESAANPAVNSFRGV
jgi:hypothetical protein